MKHLRTLLCAAWISATALSTFAQGTAFTYQGRLNDGGNAASGIYDLRFALYDLSSGGLQQGDALTNAATAVSNGLFTVTLDFGNQFPGADRWLELGVRTNGGGAFTSLIPRQPITATPYAITAANLSVALPSASLSGTYANAVTLNNGANSFSGNGANLTALNASQLASGTVPASALSNAWRIGGNGGTAPGTHFIGTTDNQPLELRVNNQRGLRLEPNSSLAPNVIGGSPLNFTGPGVVGATIAGGGAADWGGTIYTNAVMAAFGTVGGGANNIVQTDARFATIAGGYGNTIQPIAYYATVSGGELNTVRSNASLSAIGGGGGNTTDGIYGTIPGGKENTAVQYAFAAGYRAKAIHQGAFVWGDANNADISSAGANSVTMRASGGYRLFSNSGATAGVSLPAGSGSWTTLSDRNAKENFAEINPRQVLEKVAALPLATWNYKSQDASIRHMGPTAQDFRAAFGLGESETGIATIDADGVALTAIQGLNQKVESETAALRAENLALMRELTELKKLFTQLTQTQKGK
jgi:hypothetical protein